MAKKSGTPKDAPSDLAEYKALLGRLMTLSRVSSRQLLGTRPEGEPRGEFIVGIEAFKNLADIQIQVLTVLVMSLGVKKEDYFRVLVDEFRKHMQEMEKDLCVTGWNDAGQPIFDLQAYRERTLGWPD